MKNITCLLVCLGIYIYSNSQITLSRLDFPRPTSATPLPDSVAFTAVNGFNNNASAMNGPNQNWNETQLQGSASWSKFVPMSATPLVFQLVFLSCDFAKPLLGGQALGNGTLTDAYEYYNYSSNNDRLEVKGFGGNLLIPGQTIAIPVPAIYSSPDVLYRFPLMFDNKDSSVSGFDISVPLGGLGNIQIKRSQQRINHVDAWGELSIPTGTFEVLRIKSEIQRTNIGGQKLYALHQEIWPKGLTPRIIDGIFRNTKTIAEPYLDFLIQTYASLPDAKLACGPHAERSADVQRACVGKNDAPLAAREAAHRQGTSVRHSHRHRAASDQQRSRSPAAGDAGLVG